MFKRRKILTFFISLVMIISMFTGVEIFAFAQEDILSYLSYEITDGEVTITDCDPSISGDIVIPDTIDGYPVTAIGDYAFMSCTNLKSVTIGNKVTSIGYMAIVHCSSLTSITVDSSNANFSSDEYGVLFNKNKTKLIQYPIGKNKTEYAIPAEVITIMTSAFAGCDSLVNVKIPDGVKTIGSYAFNGCDSITSILIPASVTSIEKEVFCNCNSLTKITVDSDNVNYSSDEYGVLFNKNKTKLIQYPIGNIRTEYIIPASVTSIGEWSFAFCSNLKNIAINDNVTTIKDHSFYDCDNLEYIIIPDSVNSIGTRAFYNCDNLTNVTIGNGVTRIDWETFAYCTSLETITIPDSVTSMNCSVFANCSELSSVTISKNIKTIDSFTFKNCNNLKSITIPSNVTKIADGTFENCDNLESITIYNPDCLIVDSFHTIYKSATIYGYAGSTAEEYAKKYNRTFIAIEDDEPVTEEPTDKEDSVIDNEDTTCKRCGNIHKNIFENIFCFIRTIFLRISDFFKG